MRHGALATTRPETMLGDSAVAVNPEDERYQQLIGKKVLLPLMNREIPVIAEEMATHALYKLGAEFLRHYCQGIWLQDGHPRFYRHIESFYTKLLSRAEKYDLQPALVGQGR